MKNIVILIGFIIIHTNLHSQKNTENEKFAQIHYLYTSYDYGTIKQNSDGKCVFYFTNIGNSPLIIDHTATSCGCTTGNFSKKPVLPKQIGKIEVLYNTNKLGSFHKAIIVISNSKRKHKSILNIKGVVKK